MAQEYINYGNSANDGTGDPLRTAFIKTDNNFDQIWNAGPVGSNVTIINNTVGVTNTNGNLILSPNGVGNVQFNRDAIPRLTNTYNLGTANLRWRSLSVGTSGISTTGNVTANYYVGNGSQLTGITAASSYGNANVVANLVALGSNPVSTTGNVTANYFIGNGSQLTGITAASSYGNANVVANLAALGSNPISTTGNVTANYFIGNGSQLTGILASYGNANVVANLAALGSNPISTTGNVTASYFGGNGSQLTGLPAPTVTQDITSNGAMSIMTYDGVIKYVSYATVEPSSGNITGGNISATGNITGNYFIGDGSQLTNLPGGATNYIVNGNSYANIATADGNLVVNVGTDGYGIWTFETGTGNLIGPGNASQGAGIVFSADQSVYIREDMSELKVNSGSGIEITTNSGNVGNTQSWTFDATGNLTVPGNILGSGNILIAPDSASASSYLDIYLTGGPDIHIASNDNSIVIGRDTGANIFVGNDGEVSIRTDNGVTAQVWNFDDVGNLTLPGNTFAVNYANGDPVIISGGSANTGNVTFSDQIVIGTGISNLVSGLYLAPSSSSANAVQYLRVRGDTSYEPTHIHFDTGNNQYFNQFIGDDNKYVLLSNIGNIVVRTDDYTGNSAQWTFGADGNLTIPGNILGGGNILIAPDSANSDGYLDIYLTTGPDVHVASNGDSNLILGRDSGPNVLLGTSGNVSIQASNGTPHTWTFDTNSNLSAPGNISATGNVTGGNLVTAGSGGDITLTGGNITGVNNISTGTVTLVNGAVIRDTAGNAVAFGQNAGATGQGQVAIAIGNSAGNVNQGNISVAIGYQAGNTSQGDQSVAIGDSAGKTTQGESSVAVGQGAGQTTQGGSAIAIGFGAGATTQGTSAIAFGRLAGQTTQGIYGVAIGFEAGQTTQGNSAVAVGENAGYNTQGISAVAIGDGAGRDTQGQYAVAIGYGAGNSNQANNSIIINATGSVLEQTTVNTFTVAPVRNDNSNIAEIMFYNTTSKEITYGNTISIAGNVTAANFFGNGNTLSNVATTFESTWTVPVGNSTQSFTVNSGTYSMWVDCNITNGILVWNATATVTNTNVPVVGAQYAWVYNGGGTPIDFTSIPNQFVGTANAIVRSNTAPSSTTNRFDFGINNTSGNSQTVRYGWAQIS